MAVKSKEIAFECEKAVRGLKGTARDSENIRNH